MYRLLILAACLATAGCAAEPPQAGRTAADCRADGQRKAADCAAQAEAERARGTRQLMNTIPLSGLGPPVGMR